jgi:hypothetical protein
MQVPIFSYFWGIDLRNVIQTKLLLSIFLLALLFSGCRRNTGLTEHVDAYHMVYEIEYLEDKAGDIPTKILPGTMDAYYTRHFVHTSIEGFFNQFVLIQVADLRRRRVTTMLNFFGNKVYTESSPGELPAGIRDLPGLEVKDTGEEAIVGGIPSVKLRVKTDQEEYDIFYTREFHIRRLNYSTPYRSVDYPLTDFRIQLSKLKMHLTCSTLEETTVESAMFQVPEDYRLVDRRNMEEIINSLFTKD